MVASTRLHKTLANRIPLTEDQRCLVAPYAGLAVAVCRSWRRERPWLREEFQTAAMLGLVDAARHFDSARQEDIRPLIAECVRRRCSYAKRVSSRPSRREAPREIIHDMGQIPGADLSPTPFPGDTVTVLLGSLPRDEADMVRRHVLEGETFQAISYRYLIPKTTVGSIINRALNELRDHPAALAAR